MRKFKIKFQDINQPDVTIEAEKIRIDENLILYAERHQYGNDVPDQSMGIFRDWLYVDELKEEKDE